MRPALRDLGRPQVLIPVLLALAAVLVAGLALHGRQTRGSRPRADADARRADRTPPSPPGPDADPQATACAHLLVSRERVWRARVVRRHNATRDPYAHLNPLPETYGSSERELREWRQTLTYDLFEPEWTCANEERVGRPYGDGGKWACLFPFGEPGQPCLVYSVGSNYDFDFERAVTRANPRCEVHTFDPTVDAARSARLARAAGSRFHLWGIGDKPADALPNSAYDTLRGLVARLGHASAPRIDALKIDCEGCEYSPPFLDFFLPCGQSLAPPGRTFPRISQVMIELHGTDLPSVARLFAAMDACGYRIAHKERNHWGCGGYLCVEYTFVDAETARRGFRGSHCPAVDEGEWRGEVERLEGLEGERTWTSWDPNEMDDPGFLEEHAEEAFFV